MARSAGLLVRRSRAVRRRVALTLSVVLLGVVLLGGAALWGAIRQERAAHQQLAERVFDELEDELSSLVAQEERRSFLEYRYFYVPDNSATSSGLVRSPLAEAPKAPWVVGYFQVDPDGEPSFPSVPRANELELANAQGLTPQGAEEGLLDLIEGVTSYARRPAPSGPRPAPPPAQTAQQQLNRGAQKRSRRSSVKLQTKEWNVVGFEDNPLPIDQVVQEVAEPGDVDVVVGPMGGVRQGDDLLLSRQVRVGEQAYRQGVALDMNALLIELADRVLSPSGLANTVSLSYAPELAPGAFVVTPHRFAEPFQDFTVYASVQRMATLQQAMVWLLGAVALAVAVVLLAGGTAISTMVATELAYAQRRSDFVAAVSHELKTPLTSIRMYAEMLRDGMVSDPDQMRSYHSTMAEESERLTRLIHNVLELAKIERQGQAPEIRVGPLGPALQAAIQQVEPLCAAAGFELTVRLARGLPAVRYEPDGLRQVVLNLVDNALKFSSAAEVRRVEIELSAHGQGVRLSVRDHGPGIPAAQLREVFEPFYRGERELTRAHTGTGIGLALVAGLVHQMGGRCGAANRAEDGLEVWVELNA